MAALQSLGLHKPAALQYLIDESILHEDCTERDYTWETYDDSDDEGTDEVVATDYHVVWARGGMVRKMFNFEVEQEKVIQAVLTWFPTEEPAPVTSQTSVNTASNSTDLSRTFLTQGTQPATDPNAPSSQSPRVVEGKARALVVFLKSQAHVFFLTGSSHVVNLPFEVEKAFPAARGLLLQRKMPVVEHVPPSPQMPSAPPNSFLTNTQSFLSQNATQSFLQPQRLRSSLGPSRRGKSLKPGSTSAMFLEELAKGIKGPGTDGLPRVYSFTDPLSEMGLVVNVVSGNDDRGGFLAVNGSGHRRLEPIDQAEEVIYVSPKNEIMFDRSGNDKPLLLVVTANSATNVITLWSAAYLEPKSISASRKHHGFQPSKVRRRSSYGPTAPGTGATTPAVRGADRVRESFGGARRSKTHPPSFHAPNQAKERLSDQAVEDALVSQLNPNAEISRAPKDPRRVSSMLSRAELSTSFDKSAFQERSTHRTSLGGSFGASFGASQRSRYSMGIDRASFGGISQSRKRASTPGSVTSRLSLGGASIDDSLSEFLEEDTFDTIEDYDELDDLFSPPEAVFEQEPIDGLRKELVMNPVLEISAENYFKPGISSLKDIDLGNTVRVKAVFYQVQSIADFDEVPPKVTVMSAPFNSATLHERRTHVLLTHYALRRPLEIEFAVTRKRLSASASQTKKGDAAPFYACVPKLIKIQESDESPSAIKITEGHFERLVSFDIDDTQKAGLAVSAPWGIHLPVKLAIGSLKLFDPNAIFQDQPSRVTAGLKRTVDPRQPLQRMTSSGPNGTFDVVDADLRRHRLRLQLAPSDSLVSQLFHVLTTVLSNHLGEFLLEIWWTVRKTLAKELDSKADLDWSAFVTTIFSLAVPFIDEPPPTSAKSTRTSQRRGASRRSSQATSDDNGPENSAWRTMCSLQEGRSQTRSWNSKPWAWVLQFRPSDQAMSPPLRRAGSQHSPSISEQIKGKRYLLLDCANYARHFVKSPIGQAANDQWRRLSPSSKKDLRIPCLSEIVVTLHLLREERKLDILAYELSDSERGNLAPVLAQLGHWLRWDGWDWRQGSYYDLDGGSTEDWVYENTHLKNSTLSHSQPWKAPPSVLEWLGSMFRSQAYLPFPTLAMLIRKSKASPHSSINMDEVITGVTPRTAAIHRFFQDMDKLAKPHKAVELLETCGIDSSMLSTLPEAAKAPLMEAITRCQASPPTTWSSSLLRLVQREDLDMATSVAEEASHDLHQNQSNDTANTRDVHTICEAVDRSETMQSVAEVERHTVTRLIFNEDRRFLEAHLLLEPLRQSVAEFRPDSRVEEATILEGQKNLMQWVMVRTFSLPVGSSMIKFGSKKPLLTEKYPLLGFSTACLMKPMGNVVTVDRANYSEEKFFWAFFNVGVQAGLSISRDAQGIDTSWIMYNKPYDLSNKHAGLLLGLGLNGHLRNIAKWLSFKYLTPKHTMTSVGLLLGLSASFMGTMDTLVTRLLSVHVTRMLPPGAAELNLSPFTQTTGLMGIGLLYYSTQHRRMSEVMLSEIEYVDYPDPSEPPDTLRDEAYRLAAGFALGFINLGKGKDLRGLRDMRIVERLMSVAVAPKPVDSVHILDQATPGAVIAIALIFMKTGDEAVARKIDVPDTLPQFDYVRPDVFLLRTLAKHMIMWDRIQADNRWIMKNLPLEYQDDHDLRNITKLRSDQMPFYNILAGLLWSVSLRYAGTGSCEVRDFLIKYLDQFIRLTKLPALGYDSKLARNTVRNCQDLVALATATVMAGTGDLDVMRRLRGLHGRIGPETPYGSHLAAHMAFGALFIAGGTHTFSTSNKAIASLICAFYPLFPQDVQDSRAHLQAFRHFWVLAAEPRCLMVRDVDTGRATSMAITVHLKNDAASKTQTLDRDKLVKDMVAPCLLPELHTISRIETKDEAYWPTTLDFSNNPQHIAAFRLNQTLRVRRRPAHDMYASTFSKTLTALNDAQSQRTADQMWDWLFELPALREFEKADQGLILPVDPYSSTFLDSRDTVVDTRLVLRRLAGSWKVSELRELKGVFEWAERAQGADRRLRWVGREVLERLKAGVLERGRQMGS